MAVKDLYDKACEAANKGNYGYAVELYREVLRVEPEYPGARVLLRGTERRRLNELDSPLYTVTRLAKGIWPLIKAQASFGNPRKRLEACEDFLEYNPSSVTGLLMAGRAANAAGYVDTAATILKDLLSVRPDHKRALRVLSDILVNAGQAKEALKFLRRLAMLLPLDRDLQHGVKNLEAQAHMEETRMEETDSFRDMIRDKDFAQEAERRFETADRRSTRLLDEARAELEQEPGNVTKIARVADLCEQQGEVEKALRFLTDYHKRLPNAFEVRKRLGDLQLRICDQIMRGIAEKLKRDPGNAELLRKQGRLKSKRKEVALRESVWRVQQHPTDTQLRFQLGEVLFESGDTDQAISAFQQASRDPRLEEQCASMLGRCFMAKGQYDLAAEQYRRAIARHKLLDEAGMELHYLLAEALEDLGNRAEALNVYKKIYTHDIGFRDVARKVESLTT